jgi:hypothetical protein
MSLSNSGGRWAPMRTLVLASSDHHRRISEDHRMDTPADKPMKLTVACGARSLSANR